MAIISVKSYKSLSEDGGNGREKDTFCMIFLIEWMAFVRPNVCHKTTTKVLTNWLNHMVSLTCLFHTRLLGLH